MTDIKAGDEISTDWWPAAVENDDSTDILDVSNTAFAAGTPEVGVGFTSPKSGRIAVCINCNWIQQSAGNRIFFSYEVYRGADATGTLVRSARTGFGVSSSGSTAGTSEQGHGNMTMVDNLTPGVAHYARVMHSNDAGTTNDITHRRIIVFPLP